MSSQTDTIREALASGGDENQFLTFILAGEEYGVDILSVQEIKGWGGVTPIPNTPPYVRGVINLRGTIVPIVDLRLRFDLPSIEYGRTTVVIVVGVKSGESERVVGMVVDAVSDVYNIAPENVKPAPEFCASVDTAFVRGLATVGPKMVILLDLPNLLGTRELPAADAPADAGNDR